ncbi:putative holin-like toxin [Paenibacillus popilliae]
MREIEVRHLSTFESISLMLGFGTFVVALFGVIFAMQNKK